MEGSPDLQKQLEDREAEVRDLRDQLDQAQDEIDRLRQENDQLRKELKAAGRGKSRRQKRKAKRNRPGRKAGQGRFTCRDAPPVCGQWAAAASAGDDHPMSMLWGRIGVRTHRRSERHGHAGASPTGSQMIRGGSAPV